MNLVNAIAKVRFSSAKPQRVQLHKGETLQAELVCMEAGQQLKVSRGAWTYYVVMGSATLTVNGESSEVPTGQLAALDPAEPHVLSNRTERRLICLAIAKAS